MNESKPTCGWNESKPYRPPESEPPVRSSEIVSVLFGELKLSGCKNHPHRLDLSCCKIRQADGTALTTKQVWGVLNELATAKHANDKVERRAPSTFAPTPGSASGKDK